MTSMWETVPRLLGRHDYLVLGTADAEGRPWVTPVFYAARHEPTVAITIFDSHAPVGGAEAVYLEATATRVEDGDRAAALDALNAELAGRHRIAMGDVEAPGPFRIYQADVSRHFVLVRSGDERFDNVTDARLEVAPPE